VKVTLVPSTVSTADQEPGQFLSSYVFNDSLVVDAGSIGFWGLVQQLRVRHVLISHTHMDHLASLPVFLENVYNPAGDVPVTIHGSAAVLDGLQRDVFNDRVWPDFISLTTRETPFLQLALLEPYKPVELEGLRITPVPVDHTVPTQGFIVEDQNGAVVLSADTGPTKEIWERANQVANLKAVFLEATFPNAHAVLARISKHLTPALFALEVQKLKPGTPLFAVHLKAKHYEVVARELEALGLANLKLAEYGKTYEF
jgi:ribonuclease BN (tRNA processing enzyme)